MEYTLVLLKPDAVRRRLVGYLLAWFENAGFGIVAMEMRTLSREVAEAHYAEHAGKEFYPPLIDFITSGPVVALVLKGDDVISRLRAQLGATNPRNAEPGTIRHDFADPNAPVRENLVHASDSPESAAREIALFFPALAGTA